MTKVYFVRHAEPNYNNRDDMSRELSAKGMNDRELVTQFYQTKILRLFYQALIKEQLIQLHTLPTVKG